MYYAISGLGWGKGKTPEEACAQYVSAQLRNYPAQSTIFKTRPKWKAALTDGECKPDVWLAPEGTTGFVVDHKGLHWLDADDNYTPAELEQKIEA